MVTRTSIRAGLSRWAWIVCLLVFLLPAGLQAGSKGGIKGIDIIVKKQPTCGRSADDPCPKPAKLGAGGSVRFDLAEPGIYSVEVYKALGSGEQNYGNLSLTGNFALIRDPQKSAASAEVSNPVSGKTVDGNKLFAAGADHGEGSLIFATTFTVTAPVTFAGQFHFEEEIRISAQHLTYYSWANGLQTAAQTLTISNDSSSSVSYTAGFEFVGTTPWTASLSNRGGSVSAGSSGSIEVRPQAGLPAGAYNGFVRLKLQTPDGLVERVTAVTLFMKAARDKKETSRLDAPMAALYQAANGASETGSIGITNTGSQPQTYQPQTVTGTSVTPASLTLAPGATGSFNVQVAAQSSGGRWVQVCIPVVVLLANGTPYVTVKCFWVWRRGNDSAASAACTATSLQPVITQVSELPARLGHPLKVSVQVYDNCGGQRDDFTAMMSVNNGGSESHISAIQSTTKNVSAKGGQSGFKAPGGSTRALTGDDAPELVMNGALYPYFSIGSAGLTLRMDVEAPNPAGSEPLLGFVEMPLEYDSDPNVPLVAHGAFVSNAAYQSVPLAPNDIFALFALLPGLRAQEAPFPFPKSLGPVQVLIDGKTNVPLINVMEGQTQGIVPADIADGEHIVNIFYNGQMSGAIPFTVARSNSSIITIDGSNGHLYHSNGQRVSQANPGKEGEVLAVYATGLGEVEGFTIESGGPTPSIALPVKEKCKITIGDNPVEIQYCGLSGVVLYQANFVMPRIATPSGQAGAVEQMNIVLDQGSYLGPTNVLGWFQAGSGDPDLLSTVRLSFNTNPGGLSYMVNGVALSSGLGPNTYNSTSTVIIDVPQPLQFAGQPRQYQFVNWTPTPLGTVAKNTFPAGNFKSGSLLVANFVAQHKLTLIGTGTTTLVTNPSGIASTGGYYSVSTGGIAATVRITGSCPGGVSPHGLLVQTYNSSTTLPNPSTISMADPTTVTVQCSVPGPFPSCFTAPTGLIGWWTLDELSGSVAKNSGSLANADGAYTGATPVPAGKVAGAYDFSKGAVALSNIAAYNFPRTPTRAFSFDAWVKGTGLGSSVNQHILTKHILTNAGSAGYIFYLTNGRLALHLHDASNTKQDLIEPVPTHAAVNDGNWHLVAATVDFGAKQGFLYFDGVPVLSFVPDGSIHDLSNNFGLLIGAQIGPDTFQGQIDEVEIFNRALSLTEVQNLYRAGGYGKCKPLVPLVPLPLSFDIKLSGCGATITGSNPATGTNRYPNGTNMTVTANPSPGALVNIKVTSGGTTTVYTSNPATFTLTDNTTVVVDCPTKPGNCLTAPTGMVGWYSLDENTAPVNDLTANPAALTPVAGVFPDSLGKVSGGWKFLSGSLVSSGSPAKYNFGTSDFAVDAWVKFSGGQPLVSLASKINFAGPQTGFNVQVDNGVLRLDLASNGPAVIWKGTKNILSDKLWHHIVVNVSRSAGVGFFVDGSVDPLTQNPLMSSFTGSISNAEPFRLSGVDVTLDEVEIFNRTLTASEAQQLYLADAFGKCKGQPICAGAPSDSVANYSLESNVDPIIDSKGANHGTIVTPTFGLGYTPGGTLGVDTHTGFGKAVKFPLASRSAIKLSGNPVNPSIDDMTFTTYVKLDPNDNTTVHHDGIWGQYWYDSDAFYHLGLEASSGTSTSEKMQFVISDGNQGGGPGGYKLWYGPAVPRDNLWHCIGFRLRHLSNGQGELQMFMDGVFSAVETTNTLVAQNDSAATFFGWTGYNTSTLDTRFLGSLDEIQIFKRKLSDAELTAICNCQGNQEVNVLVNTSVSGTVTSAGLKLTVQGTTITNSTTYTAPGGSVQTHDAQNQLVSSSGLYYTHTGWTPTGSGPGLQNVTLPASGSATYTADFKLSGYLVTVVNTPGCSVNIGPASLLISSNPFVMPIGVPLTVTAGVGNPTGVSVGAGGGVAFSFGNFQVPSQIGPFGGPVVITPSCPTGVVHTVTTNPGGLKVQIDGAGLVNAPQTTPLWIPASAHQLGTQSPQLNTAGDTQYTLSTTTPWTASGGAVISSGGQISSAPLTATTYTAIFTVAYKITYTVTGNCSSQSGTVGLGPGSSSVFVPAGSPLNISIAPAAGNSILNASLNGGAQTIGPNGTVVVNVNSVNGPQTIIVNCSTSVTLTVATNPSSLDARIGSTGNYAPAPLVRQVIANQTQTISVIDPQVLNGTGYRFTGWSTGGSTATTTVQPASNFTATANFQVACYQVTVQAGASGNVTLNPASGGLTGFPANCYAPGTQVRILSNANLGYGVKTVVISAGGSTQTVTTDNTPIFVNSPTNVVVTFVPRPATISTIFPPVAASGAFQSNVFFANPTPTAGSNLRIVAVSFQTTGGTGTVTLNSTLPLVFGSLPANGQSSTVTLQYQIPATVTTFNIFVTVEVSNSLGDVFTTQVSAGHSHP